MVRRVRRTRRKAKGGINWRSLLSKAHRYAKDNKLASRGLRALNFNKAADIASILGYGKSASVGGRRRRYRRRRAVGGSFWGDVWKGIKSVGKVGTAVAGAIPLPQTQAAAAVGRAVGLGKQRGGRKVAGGNRSTNPYVMIY